MHITSSFISTLAANEVFVFGSNLRGIHGAGAALLARRCFGAIHGVAAGMQGNSYAIPTKDEALKTLPVEDIGIFVAIFLRHAAAAHDRFFRVTAIGCGLAGYTPSDIAPLFFRHRLPPNLSLPAEFVNLKPQSK